MYSWMKSSNLACCWRRLAPGGLVVRRSALTSPCRCNTAWMVLLAGIRISPSKREKPHWGARKIRELLVRRLVPLEDLVAGLAGDAKLPTDVGHRFAFEQLRYTP